MEHNKCECIFIKLLGAGEAGKSNVNKCSSLYITQNSLHIYVLTNHCGKHVESDKRIKVIHLYCGMRCLLTRCFGTEDGWLI
jgi:hypothetical protein